MKTMEHTDAVRMNAVERYLLGEMGEDERAIFEEHFFSCGHCVAAINAGTQLMIAGKLVAQEAKVTQAAENVVPIRKRWRWMPQAAAASLLLLIGTQIPRVMPRVPSDALRFISMVPVDLSEKRSQGEKPDPLRVPAGATISFEMPVDELAESYVAEIEDRSGKSIGFVPISLSQAAEDVPLELGELPAGSYDLVISSVRKGGNRVEIARRVMKVGER